MYTLILLLKDVVELSPFRLSLANADPALKKKQSVV